jgi:hypothetical protein
VKKNKNILQSPPLGVPLRLALRQSMPAKMVALVFQAFSHLCASQFTRMTARNWFPMAFARAHLGEMPGIFPYCRCCPSAYSQLEWSIAEKNRKAIAG